MRKTGFMVALMLVLCLFSGCSETESGARVIRLGAGIVDHVGLSEVEYPKKASIYLGETRDLDYDAAADLLLTDAYGPDREELLSVTPEEGSISYSVAIVDPAGEVTGYAYDLKLEAGDTVSFSDIDQLMEYYHAALCMPADVMESSNCRQAKQTAEDLLKRLGITDYRLDAAVETSDADRTQFDCALFWEQTVDDIPVSSLEITEGMSSGRRSVYNSEQGFHHEITQMGSFGDGTRISMHVTNGKLTNLYACLVDPVKVYDTRSVIPAKKAFRYVEDLYKDKDGAKDPRLEVAELQYKCFRDDGQIYFYPVWVFGVAEYDDTWAQADTQYGWANQWMETGDYYYYYMLDAFSGELLLNPKLE